MKLERDKADFEGNLGVRLPSVSFKLRKLCSGDSYFRSPLKETGSEVLVSVAE